MSHCDMINQSHRECVKVIVSTRRLLRELDFYSTAVIHAQVRKSFSINAERLVPLYCFCLAQETWYVINQAEFSW